MLYTGACANAALLTLWWEFLLHGWHSCWFFRYLFFFLKRRLGRCIYFISAHSSSTSFQNPSARPPKQDHQRPELRSRSWIQVHEFIKIFIKYYSICLHLVRRQKSTSAEEVARFRRLFPNLSWLSSGRTSGHQNLISIFPWIDNCLKVAESLKVGCLPYAGTWMINWWWLVSYTPSSMSKIWVRKYP